MSLAILVLAVLTSAAYVWRMSEALKLASDAEQKRFAREARFPWWGTAILVAAFVALFVVVEAIWRVFIALGIVLWVLAGSVWQRHRMQLLGFDQAFSKRLLHAALLGTVATSLFVAWLLLPA